MPRYLFTNNAKSELAAAITNVAVTIYLKAGEGAKFPAPAANQQFPLTLVDSSGNIEVVYCTARSTDALTVIRAREGTTARAFALGSKAELRLTAGILGELMQSYDNIPPGTKMLFHQSAAPIGWTQDTSVNDRVLRVVSGAGGGTGGSWTISGMSVNAHALHVNEMPGHTHAASTGSDGAHTHSVKTKNPDPQGAWGAQYINNGSSGDYNIAGAALSAGAHTHTVIMSATGGNAAHTHGLTVGNAWRPLYVDVISCSKN